MDFSDSRDIELAARLRRLDATAGAAGPGFDYDALLDRHAARQTSARRRLSVARGVAGALAIALVSLSVWRFDQAEAPFADASPDASTMIEEPARALQPRIVRADTYLAVAALEDHIASIDDELSVARVHAGAAEVARLERTRAELFDSYTRVRYAEMLSANL